MCVSFYNPLQIMEEAIILHMESIELSLSSKARFRDQRIINNFVNSLQKALIDFRIHLAMKINDKQLA